MNTKKCSKCSENTEMELIDVCRETPEERCIRICKEDEIMREKRYKEQEEHFLIKRRLKRIAVVEKHKEFLDAIIISGQKGIRFRRFFQNYVIRISQMEFLDEEQEYKFIGKPGRLEYTNSKSIVNSFTKSERIIVNEIMHEFGCFNY